MAISSTTGTLASSGVGSGLDVAGLVNKLMAAESQPLTTLATKEASYQAKITAYGSLKGTLSALQAAIASLTDAASMKPISASLADSSLASVAASTSAVPGTYAVEVANLASAHKIASTGFASVNDTVGTGTLTFAFGTWDGTKFVDNASAPARTVTIGAGQATLAGIRDAVNAANIGVTATIVNDGQTLGNRLVFTSGSTGAANSLKVTVSDADTTDTNTSGLSVLSYDPAAAVGSGLNLSQKVAAKDAQLVIDGITVNKPSNTITDAIDGVTFNLQKASPGTTTTLTVAADSSSIAKSVAAFVKAYNDVATTIAGLTKYDATNKKASLLTGDSAPRVVQSQLRSVLTGLLTGSGLALTGLTQVGVTFKADGTLSLDSAKLSAAVSSNSAGVVRLFAPVATATDRQVSVDTGKDTAVPGSYAIDVTQLATQGAAVGATAAGLSVTTGVNDILSLAVDGIETDVQIAAGTYASTAALATEIQAKVNSALAGSGAGVRVTESSGVLTVTSNSYGSASTLAVAGTAAAGLFGTATVTGGVDVAGSIGGYAAEGSGQTLTAVTGDASGLAVTVTGGSTGARGQVDYTQGYGWKLDAVLKSLLGSDGPVAASTDGVNKRIKDIDKQRVALQTRLDRLQVTYLAKFRALDTMLASMNSTSTYLTQQLDALASMRDGILSNK